MDKRTFEAHLLCLISWSRLAHSALRLASLPKGRTNEASMTNPPFTGSSQSGSSQKRVDQGSEAAGVEEAAGDVVGQVSEPARGPSEVFQ